MQFDEAKFDEQNHGAWRVASDLSLRCAQAQRGLLTPGNFLPTSPKLCTNGKEINESHIHFF
jgi:hypothetical protein